jgi:hypothetical protein
MALRNALILRKSRSGCLEGCTALLQPTSNSFTASEDELSAMPSDTEHRRTARNRGGQRVDRDPLVLVEANLLSFQLSPGAEPSFVSLAAGAPVKK